MHRIVPKERQQKIEKNFHDYGVLVLLFARLTPTIRAPIFIMAGVMRLPFSRFLLADGIYAIPGVSLLFFLGYYFGEGFIRLILAFEGKVEAARPILVLLIIAAVATYLFFHFLKHPWATGDPAQEVPLIGGQVAAKLTHADSHSSTSQKEKSPAEKSSGNVAKRGKQAMKYLVATAGGVIISVFSFLAIFFVSSVVLALPLAIFAGAASFLGTLKLYAMKNQ